MISTHPKWESYKEAPIKGNLFKRWLKSRFHFVDYPFLLAYRGFGNEQKMLVQGHVFRGMALNRPNKKANLLSNLKALLKMFLVRTVSKATVQLRFENKVHEVTTHDDGFFEFEMEHELQNMGWNEVELSLKDELVEGQMPVKLVADVLLKRDFEYGIITDIDDTFLVSHATKKLKKLYTLLTKNAESRRAFVGAAQFFEKLEKGQQNSENPFFYVSSSEWNLYDFLIEFIQLNKFPKGVLQLKDIKDGFLDFFKSGLGSHLHKVHKIERILKTYPNKQFVLIGDNGQHDPLIYNEIVKKHKGRIKAVFIRGVRKNRWTKTDTTLAEIEKSGVSVCQFKISLQAEEYAKEIGLIS
jgi:phosphatidate phosphatase APP1